MQDLYLLYQCHGWGRVSTLKLKDGRIAFTHSVDPSDVLDILERPCDTTSKPIESFWDPEENLPEIILMIPLEFLEKGLD